MFEIVNGTTTFRDLLYGDEFCGGIRDGNDLKAFVPGGGSAPWFLPDQLDLPFEGKPVGAAGSMLGSGAIMVMDETTDIPVAAQTLVPLLRPRSHAASACPAAKAARGSSGSWSASSTARARRADLDQLIEVGESICPGAFPHAASERLGLEAVPFPYKMTTICFVGRRRTPGALRLTLFREEFDRVTRHDPGRRTIPSSTRPREVERATRRADGRHASRVRDQRATQVAARAGASRPLEQRRRTPTTGHDAPSAEPSAAQDASRSRSTAAARRARPVRHRARRAAASYIPRFCYHHADDARWACAACASSRSTPAAGPMLQPSCMAPVAPT